jgi:hypothetical protein
MNDALQKPYAAEVVNKALFSISTMKVQMGCMLFSSK